MHYKLKGEFGPWFIARAYEEAGEAVGYRRLAGMDLLSQEQRERFALLPLEFTFSEAERIYGKNGGKPTSEWLRRCLAAGLLVKTGQGKTTRYRKTGEPHNPGNVGTDNVKYV